MKVAIQGIAACFHEMAAQKYFNDEIQIVPCMTFHDLCESLEAGQADYAVMAIENSIAGSLLQNYALLMKYEFQIVGEVYLNIQMNLMALPGQDIGKLKTVQSHPIALSQCADFLWSLPHLRWVEVEDTAWSAKDIAENKKCGVAAVANTLAAEKYGLDILARRIETHKQNFTRFLILSKRQQKVFFSDKASSCLLLKHEKGSLSKVLNVLALHQVNLTKIQSVPIIGKPYEYQFHVDMEWENYEAYQKAINEISPFATSVKVLGEYKKGNYELL